MQTPPSILAYLVYMCIYNVFIYIQKNWWKCKITVINLFHYVNNEYNKVSLDTKEEILDVIKKLEKDDKLINSNYNNNSDLKNFKSFANGVFQAEGHIGGYFINKNKITFRPIVFIGLTVNVETLL